MSTTVYIPDSVQKVDELHRDLLSEYPGPWSVRFVLDKQAHRLFEAYVDQDSAVCVQLSNWHPECIGCTSREIMAKDLSLNDMRIAIAREHGYKDWKHVLQEGGVMLNETFEHGISHVLDGDIKALEALIWDRPGLVKECSKYAHRATWLHYLSGNGVETWRQRIPSNASEIARLLLHHGADVGAKAHVYGGKFTALELLITSAHPGVAGVAEDLVAVLREARDS